MRWRSKSSATRQCHFGRHGGDGVHGIVPRMTSHLRYVVVGLFAGWGSAWVMAQPSAWAPVVGITSEDIQPVLHYTGSEGAGTDRQMRVVDLGAYRLGVGVLHRAATRPGA